MSTAGVPAADLSVGDEVEVDVGPVAHGGHCVARHEGRVVFVRHTLPGERVRVRVTEAKPGQRFVRGDAVEVLDPSPHRVPPCPYAGPGLCGGCDFQHVTVEQQRHLKAAVVREQFARLAGLDVPVEVEAVPGDHEGLGWRTRMEFAVDATGTPGLRRHRSHDVLPVKDCLIAHDRVRQAGVLTRQWPGERAVDVVAPSVGSDAVVVAVPSGEPAVPVVRERVEVGSWVGTFEVGARGFWQVHPGAATTFVRAVLDAVDPRPGSAPSTCMPVSGSSPSRSRTLSARRGRARRGGGGAGHGGRTAQHRGAAVGGAPAGARGARPETAGAAGNSRRPCRPRPTPRGGRPCRRCAGRGPRPARVAYVACDPAALARDTAYLREAGYGLRAVRAFDAFPMTHHVECLAVFEPAARP